MCFLLVFFVKCKVSLTFALHLEFILISWEDEVTKCNLDYMLMQLTCKQQQQRAFSHSFDAHVLSEPRVQRAIDMWCGREAGFMCRRAVYWLLWGLQLLDVSEGSVLKRPFYPFCETTSGIPFDTLTDRPHWNIERTKLAHTWDKRCREVSPQTSSLPTF